MPSQTLAYTTPEEYLKAERKDASVVCGRPEVFQTDNLVNPIVIIEVLSQSTERHDRTTKFLEYQSIPSLKEYLMISQQPRSVTHCTRLGGEQWRIETFGEERALFA